MIAYFDCFAGIAGDMTIAALIDLGVDAEYLRERLSRLPLTGYTLDTRRSTRRNIAGVRFLVDIHGPQPHRKFSDIRDIILSGALPPNARDLSLHIFHLIGEAEAAVHGVPLEDVHFHEVGAVDSIIDIVGTAISVSDLGIDSVICSPLPMSRTFVQTMHGTLPSPAPATLEILKGVPVTGNDASMEMVTPTGAAIVRALAQEFGPYPSFVPERIGYGLGTSDSEEFPNALRIVLGSELPGSHHTDQVALLECQVDDLDPRVLGDLMPRLLGSGALDVWFSAVHMKKNRPGTMVHVLVSPDNIASTSDLVLTHTSSIGVRVSFVNRVILPRSISEMETSLGKIRVKIVQLPDGRVEHRPEFEDVLEIANRDGKSAREVLQILERELSQLSTS